MTTFEGSEDHHTLESLILLMAAHRHSDQEIPPDLTDVPQDVWAVKGGPVGLIK